MRLFVCLFVENLRADDWRVVLKEFHAVDNLATAQVGHCSQCQLRVVAATLCTRLWSVGHKRPEAAGLQAPLVSPHPQVPSVGNGTGGLGLGVRNSHYSWVGLCIWTFLVDKGNFGCFVLSIIYCKFTLIFLIHKRVYFFDFIFVPLLCWKFLSLEK